MSWLASLAPEWALRREVARRQLERLYDAAKPSHEYRIPTDRRSADAVVEHSRDSLRRWMRHLDENHDLVAHIFDIIGLQTSLLSIEPQIRLTDGSLAQTANRELARLWEQWGRRPETTNTLSWAGIKWLLGRSWGRDGENFIIHRLADASYPYATAVPYVLELLEADFLPFDSLAVDRSEFPRTVHGVQKDQWGRPVKYHFYVEHPGLFSPVAASSRGIMPATTPVDASVVSHLKFVRRLHQTRGVTMGHASIKRLHRLGDYEESEEIAASIAASWTAFITRDSGMGTPLEASSDIGTRTMEMQAGMIFDNLLPGEKPEIIGASRPSDQLLPYRKAMLRAAAGGVGVSASTAALDYEGTYSSQRQELAEIMPVYNNLREAAIGMLYWPIYSRFARACLIAGLVPMAGVDGRTLTDAMYSHGQTPWIDPDKESKADEREVANGFESRQGVMRRRGRDPRRVDAERERDTFVKETPNPEAGDEPEPDDDDEEAAA